MTGTVNAKKVLSVINMCSREKSDVDGGNGNGRRPPTSACILSSNSLDGYIIEANPEQSGLANLSVTTVLNYCKKKILNPYLRLLSLVGLRSLILNRHEPCLGLKVTNHLYTVLLILMLVTGHFLQYMACFRRDRGFCFKQELFGNASHNVLLVQSEINAVYELICKSPVVFSFIIPSILHLFGYLMAMFVIRHSDDDQLPVLMERVFLTSTNLSSGLASQRKLVRTLWFFVSATAIWMVLSIVTINLMLAHGTVTFKWAEYEPESLILFLKMLLVLCTIWQDLIQTTIVSNYCLQTHLLTSYLQFLREKLVSYPIEPLEWIRHIENFKKMLAYINDAIAPSVCIFTFLNISCSISGVLWIFNYDNIEKEDKPPVWGVSMLNVALWVVLAIAPFIQAARLTNACDVLRQAGQEARTRPFVHQDTPGYELDSILLFTTSLKLKARLFFIPITRKYLSLAFTLAAVILLVLGQCHYLSDT